MNPPASFVCSDLSAARLGHCGRAGGAGNDDGQLGALRCAAPPKNSYEDECFAALSEHGDAANADCGEERDY